MPLIWTAEQLAEHVFASTYLIEPWFPRGGVAMCYGKRGIGKSHFALTLAACLTEGSVLFGRYRTRKGPVIYVQADMVPPLQQQRIRQAIRTYRLDNLYLTFPDFLNLPQLKPNDEIVQRINDLNPEFIVWDTLRRITRMDLSSDETVEWVYGSARHLFPGATHFFIHHDKKTIVDEGELDPEESFRGSGAWLDNADAGLKLKEAGAQRLYVEFTKVRTCGPQQGLTLSLSTEQMLLYALGEQVDQLIERWMQQHAYSSTKELERFLLSCFVAPPRTVKALVEQARSRWGLDRPVRLVAEPKIGEAMISV